MYCFFFILSVVVVFITQDLRAKVASLEEELARSRGECEQLRLEVAAAAARSDEQLRLEVQRLSQELLAAQAASSRASSEALRSGLAARKWEQLARAHEADAREKARESALVQKSHDEMVVQQGTVLAQSIRLLASQEEERRRNDSLEASLGDLPDLAKAIAARDEAWAAGVALQAANEDKTWRLAALENEKTARQKDLAREQRENFLKTREAWWQS
jgi:hypothetical protein